MIRWKQVAAVARLDLAEVRRSRWLTFASVVYGLLAVVFVIAALRESSVVEFTGMDRVLLSLSHALLLVLPLLALSATCQVVNRARDDGTLELLFSHPLSRASYLVGVTATRLLVLLAPLAGLIAVMVVAGAWLSEPTAALRFGLRALAVCSALLWASVGAGMAVSAATRDQARALVYGLVLWALGVALLDFALVGAMLQWQLNPRAVFLLAAMNPVQAARLGLLSGLEPELGTLGPVGFYLATRLGPAKLFAVGVAWPLTVGVGAWAFALQSFRRGDAV